MPLFGSSQESKNRRHFERAAEAVFRASDSYGVNDAVSLFVRLFSEEWMTWWTSGVAAATQAVNTVPSIKQAWGSGGPKEALSLALLFTLPMVPRFYRWGPLARAKSSDERMRDFERGLKAVTHLFEVPSLKAPPALLAEYMQLAVQFDYSENQREQTGRDLGPGGLLEARYLASRALTACGQPSEFELSNVRFPVDSESEFVDEGGKLGQLNNSEVFALDAIVNGAATAMVQPGKWR